MAKTGDSLSKIEVTVYFSATHFDGALYHSEQARYFENAELNKLEIEGAGKKVILLANSAVLNAVGFLEALVNELRSDARPRDGNPTEQIEALGEELRAKMDSLTRRQMKGPLLAKYQLVLETLQRPKLEETSSVWEHASALIKLRNYLVHYHSQERDLLSEDPSDKLLAALSGKFRTNPNYDNVFTAFEARYLSAGCAEWAVQAAKSFTDEFYKNLRIDPPYKSRLEST